MAQFDQPHLLAPNRKETKKEEQLTHVTGCDNNSGLLTFHPHSLDSGEGKNIIFCWQSLTRQAFPFSTVSLQGIR